jgi:ferrochelatase
LRSTLRELGANGIKDVCVVPISFVSDHVETLGEIDHEGRELAAEAGITRFEMTEGLNDSPIFIGALAQLVTACVQPGVRKEPAFANAAMRAVAKG